MCEPAGGRRNAPVRGGDDLVSFTLATVPGGDIRLSIEAIAKERRSRRRSPWPNMRRLRKRWRSPWQNSRLCTKATAREASTTRAEAPWRQEGLDRQLARQLKRPSCDSLATRYGDGPGHHSSGHPWLLKAYRLFGTCRQTTGRRPEATPTRVAINHRDETMHRARIGHRESRKSLGPSRE